MQLCIGKCLFTLRHSLVERNLYRDNLKRSNSEVRLKRSLVFLVLGLSLFLSGFYSGDTVMTTLGAVLAFAGLSSFLTLHFVSENRLKRTLEVFSAVAALGMIVAGYVLTGNITLGIVTAFMAVMIFTAFVFSYVLPKVRGGSK